MTVALVAVADEQPERPVGWEALLRSVVRPEFQVDVYVAKAGDPVLFGPTCLVAGCDARGLQRADGARGHLCDGHARMWRRDGQPPQTEWLEDGARSLRHRRPVIACAAADCPRSVHQDGLCRPHRQRWVAAGRPPLQEFAERAASTRTGSGECRVEGCDFVRVCGGELCDAHQRSYAWLRWKRGGLDLERFLAHVHDARGRTAPRFDLRGVPAIVALELGYALQCRHDQRGAAITPLIYGQVLRWLQERPVDSMSIGSDAAWALAAEQRFAKSCRRSPLGWVRFCRSVLGRLRDERHGGEVWEWDTWPTDRIDPDGRYAHQPVRRIYFADIEPEWLRELAKRWARWRITTTTKSPASIAVSTSSLRRFTTWLADRDALPQTPAAITRELLED